MPTFDNLRREQFSELKDLSTRGPEHNTGISAYDTSRAKRIASKNANNIIDNNIPWWTWKRQYKITFDKKTMDLRTEIVK